LEKPKSPVVGFALWGALGLFTALSGLAAPTRAQALEAPCGGSGFDICFPDLDTGAPSKACAVSSSSGASASIASQSAAARDAATITACLGRVCRDAASEPSPGFFEYCCARGGSQRYDDYCVWVVQTTCSGVADLCAERCPPLELLTGTVTLAPPPSACFASYPPFIASVCAADPFCCATSWDSICAEEALAASP
jgi:hypothetical protein